jgi:DNA-binding transcriptional ArsR family regulator
MDLFTALADPTRRDILAALQRSARSVNELAAELDVSQPTMSKHLKALREAGFLSCRVAAQQRIYQLEPARFQEIAAWLDPYRRMWNRHLDELEAYLERKEHQDERKTVRAAAARGRQSRTHATKRR